MVEWVARLNAWKRGQWAEFLRAPLQTELTVSGGGPGGDSALVPRKGGEGLMGYAHSSAVAGRTVMVTSFCTAGDPWQGNLARPDAGVKEYLARSGVHRVVTGHKVLFLFVCLFVCFGNVCQLVSLLCEGHNLVADFPFCFVLLFFSYFVLQYFFSCFFVSSRWATRPSLYVRPTWR